MKPPPTSLYPLAPRTSPRDAGRRTWGEKGQPRIDPSLDAHRHQLAFAADVHQLVGVFLAMPVYAETRVCFGHPIFVLPEEGRERENRELTNAVRVQ